MLVILYFLALVVAGILLLALLFKIRRPNARYILSFVFVMIANAGFLCLAVSQHVSEAILANKLICFGGAFLPMLMLLTIADICKRRFPRWLIVTLFLCSFFVMCTMFTVGYNGFYYVSVSIKKYMGVTYLDPSGSQIG